MSFDITPFVNEIETQNRAVEGIIVFQNGRELAHHRWKPEAPRTIYSAAKSFVSIAAGMAIDEGILRLSDRVTKILPRKEKEKNWDSLTLEHLLTMTMGHAKFTRPASLQEALSYELARKPGACFVYDNTCTFLVSCMITKASGQKTRDFLLDRLFRPLKIADPEWQETDGYTTGATGLLLTTSQMARFGQLLLQRGNWEGRQLVCAAWIDAATRTQVPTRSAEFPHFESDCDLGYGYQFWTCRHGAYRADGKDGQFIIVLPAHEAVISINANEANHLPVLQAVWDHILPQL